MKMTKKKDVRDYQDYLNYKRNRDLYGSEEEMIRAIAKEESRNGKRKNNEN